MKNSIVLVAAAILCLVAFSTTTVGRYWPNGWPNPSAVSKNELMMYLNTGHHSLTSFNYGDSTVWKCTYSNGSAPAISISPSTPSTPSKPSPSPPTPKTSPPPPTPKKSPPPPTPSLPPPTPKKSPSPPPSVPPPTLKKSPSPPSTPSLPPPTPKKLPSPPPSDDQSSSPSNRPPEHHHSHHQNPLEHIESCMRNMGPVGMCRMQMEVSFYTRLFQVSNYCCNLVVNMKSECDDVAWGFFNDPFFVPLVRYTCHVTS